jgi:hypothetical protein
MCASKCCCPEVFALGGGGLKSTDVPASGYRFSIWKSYLYQFGIVSIAKYLRLQVCSSSPYGFQPKGNYAIHFVREQLNKAFH